MLQFVISKNPTDSGFFVLDFPLCTGFTVAVFHLEDTIIAISNDTKQYRK